MTTTVTVEFTGDLPPAPFAAFAAHRAARLSVVHEVVAQDAGRAVIRLTGAAALVEAFEMALSLGPAECLVRDVRRLETASGGGAR